MSVKDNFIDLLKDTDIMKQVDRTLQDEPIKLLLDICKRVLLTGRPAPDHGLHLQGYIGDVALKALIEAGLIERQDGGKVALYCYRPTESGMAFYNDLTGEAGIKN